MKITQILSVFLVLLFSAERSISQIDPVGNFNRHVFEKWTGEYIRIGGYRVKGSPFLLGEAFNGIITYKDGKTVSNEKILYNLYSQKAGIDINKQIFERDIPLESFSINLPEHLGGEKLLFNNSYVYGRPELKGFLNVLEDGNRATLLKMFKIKLVTDPTNNLDKDRKVFEQYSEYYIYLKSSKTLHSIKTRKKDILKVLSQDNFFVQYTLNKEIDFSKETELIAMINSYNRS